MDIPRDLSNCVNISSNGVGPFASNARSVRVLGSTFNIDSRYEIIEILGSGAYGIVVSARDSKTGQLVAIKKIEKAFDHSEYTKRTLRELKILRLLDNENLLKIFSIQRPNSKEEFAEIYVICELMETDLSSIIKSPQGLSDDHVQLIIYQILRGLNYMHSARILHRDLKPRNVLVNSSCDVKICDFGLARPYTDELRAKSCQMTDYVSTRWYRAPEVLLCYKEYSEVMDIWSVGCIMGEILLRRPLLPGSCTEHQIDLILNLLGTPDEDDIASIPSKKAQKFINKFEKRNGKKFGSVFRHASPEAVDLLRKMLQFNPCKRITAREALAHPYFRLIQYPEDEPITDPVSMFEFQYENEVLTMRELKTLIYEEILLYHEETAKQEHQDRKDVYMQNS